MRIVRDQWRGTLGPDGGGWGTGVRWWGRVPDRGWGFRWAGFSVGCGAPDSGSGSRQG